MQDNWKRFYPKIHDIELEIEFQIIYEQLRNSDKEETYKANDDFSFFDTEPKIGIMTEDLELQLLSVFSSLQEAQVSLKDKLYKKLNVITTQGCYNTGCWEWTGSKNSYGYGAITLTNGNIKHVIRVHRISYFVHFFRLPPMSLCVMHKCDNPSCFNPEHLFIGTQKQNMQDCSFKGRIKNGYSKNVEFDYRGLDRL